MKWVRYGLWETASKGRRECMDSCRIDVSEELDRYVATEQNARSFATDRAGRVLCRYVATERDVCSVATLRPSLARARSLRSDRAGRVLGRYMLEYWQRDKFWDLVSRFLILCLEMLETNALSLGQDLGLLLVLEGAMTNSTYVSRFSFILIPYRFKVRDSFPARPLRSGFYVEVIRRVAADGILYGLCKLAGFLKTLEYWQRDKFWDLVSRFLILCLEMLETSALGLGQDLGLLLVLEGAMTNSTYVSRFSFILIPYRFKVRDRGLVLALRLGNILTNSGLPFSRQVIGAVVAQLFWLCMKAVLSFIAKDVVAKGLDHDTFVLSIRPSREIKPKKLDTEPVRSQLRGDFLLGRDQAE
ncbi:hypothetical protein F2Q69_00022632 [Brassica cretica]|uniref:Uncharacterized protein n=1 Tax=Brassica cretica TaxID=69181 RepID=A0A8S9PYY8_BRACR|nr:hypothetical protein F2Q69_00022632 [Brassica cretica]